MFLLLVLLPLGRPLDQQVDIVYQEVEVIVDACEYLLLGRLDDLGEYEPVWLLFNGFLFGFDVLVLLAAAVVVVFSLSWPLPSGFGRPIMPKASEVFLPCARLTLFKHVASKKLGLPEVYVGPEQVSSCFHVTWTPW